MSTRKSSLHKKLKKKAREIQKSNEVKYSAALELAAVEFGFKSHFDFIHSQPSTEKSIEKYIGLARDVVQHILVSDDLSENFTGEFDVGFLRSCFLNTFDKGFNQDDFDRSAYWRALSYGMNKELVKDFGHRFMNDETRDISDRVQGSLWIAIGHFFRSAATCLGDGRGDHASFSVYMADWLESVDVVKDDGLYELLVKLYPPNEVVMMLDGSSIWASINGQPFVGRKPGSRNDPDRKSAIMRRFLGDEIVESESGVQL